MTSMRSYLRIGRSGIAWAHAIPCVLWIDPASPVLAVCAASGWVTLFYLMSCKVNDLADIASDSANPQRSLSPLVSGAVSPLQATYWVLADLIILVVALFIAPITLQSQILALAALVLTIYGNTFQKTSLRVHPLAMDLTYGLTMALLLAAASGLFGSHMSPERIAAIAGFGFVVSLLNLVAGNFKDFHADRNAGSRTTAHALGCTVDDHGRIMLTRKFLFVAATLQVASTAGIATSVMDPATRTGWPMIVSVCTGIACAAGCCLFFGHIRNLRRYGMATGDIKRPKYAFYMLFAVCSSSVLATPLTLGLAGAGSVLFFYYIQRLLRYDTNRSGLDDNSREPVLGT